MNLLTVAVIVGAATSIGTSIIGFYYVLHYLDRMEQRILAEIRRLSERMDRFEQKLNELTIEVRAAQGRELIEKKG